MRWRTAAWAPLLLAGCLIACAGPPQGDPAPASVGAHPAAAAATPPVASPPLTPQEQATAYRRSLADAAVAEPSEVFTNLVALTPDDPRVEWKGAADDRRVLLVTWTSWDGYAKRLGESLKLAREIWAGVAGEFRPWAVQVPPEERELRYRQVLGLPPDVAKTVFVELWVRPSDIFRPTPDPEIDDRTAALDFPPGTPKAHVRWIEKLRGSSYGDGGYPWTRLGYTYDWGGDPQDDVGFSEFIVRAGATVEVHSVTATASYGQ